MLGKKILIGIDGSLFAENAFDYALQLFNDERTLMIGVFVNNLNYTNQVSHMPKEQMNFKYAYDVFELKEHNETEARKKLMRHFIEKCSKERVKFIIHNDNGSPAQELINESKFADLIIIGFQTYSASLDKENDQKLLRELLKESLCPVLIVPLKVNEIRKLIFTYDGKSSSLYAIKQFCYLIPKLCRDCQATLLTALKHENESIDAIEEKLLVEYLKQHCKDIGVLSVLGEPQDAIIRAVDYDPNSLIVMGAYGRSSLSMFFHSSTADKILKSQKAPTFITHK